MTLRNLENYGQAVKVSTVEIPDITIINGTGVAIEQLQYSYEIGDDGLRGYSNCFENGVYMEADEEIVIEMDNPGIIEAELPMLEINWKVFVGSDRCSVEGVMKAGANGRFGDTYVLEGDRINGFVLRPLQEQK